MNLTYHSKILLNILLNNNISQIDLSINIKKFLSYIFDIFSDNYQLDSNTFKQLKKEREIINPKINNINDGSIFMPDNIINYINNTESIIIRYKFNIKSRKIILSYYIFDNINNLYYYDLYTYYVKMILHLLSQHSSSNCNKKLNIKIYMTSFNRILPFKNNEIIDVKNVNGGYANFCISEGNITVYRKEEWFKVFIHECFHSFGLEYSNLDLNNFNKKISAIYSIQSKYNIFESYTEIWAEIINICFIAFLQVNNNNNCTKKNYYDIVQKLLSIEREFSLIQLKKILNFNGISYNEIYKSDKYKENTNVFAYYVIKNLLFWNLNDFIKWCYKYNINYFNFTKKQENLDLFFILIEKLSKKDNSIFIKKLYNNKLFNNMLNKNNNFFKFNLRMTSLEL